MLVIIQVIYANYKLIAYHKRFTDRLLNIYVKPAYPV